MMKTQQKDIEIFIIAKQCNLNINEDIHMLGLISDLMDSISKQSDDSWSFRYINEQRFYWQNRKKTIKRVNYPFLSDIIERIQRLKALS